MVLSSGAPLVSGTVLGSIPLSTSRRKKASKICFATSLRPVANAIPGKAIMGVAAPVAKPWIARDDRLSRRLVWLRPFDHKLIGRENQLRNPRRAQLRPDRVCISSPRGKLDFVLPLYFLLTLEQNHRDTAILLRRENDGSPVCPFWRLRHSKPRRVELIFAGHRKPRSLSRGKRKSRYQMCCGFARHALYTLYRNGVAPSNAVTEIPFSLGSMRIRQSLACVAA